MMTKIRLSSVYIAFISLLGCKSNHIKYSPIPEMGKYKIAILYSNGEGKTFDMDYYEKKHMPMVAGFLGKNLLFYEIDKGIAGSTPNDKVPFLAIGYFYINDVAEYNKAILQNIETIISDIKKYTNIQPTIQVSEIQQIGHIE